MATQNFDWTTLRKIGGWEGRLIAQQSLRSFKKGNRNLNFHSSEPFLDIPGRLVQCDHSWRKQTNKHPSVIFLLAKKKYKFPHFFSWKLKNSTIAFSDTPNLIVWFFTLSEFSPFFPKSDEFSKVLSFWYITLSLF